jgi:hypothetical protein
MRECLSIWSHWRPSADENGWACRKSAEGEITSQIPELLELIDLSRNFKQYQAAASGPLCCGLAAKPALADDLDHRYRFLAARSAALAAAGKGRDPGSHSAQDKARLRGQALAWLRADLQLLTKQFQARDPKAPPGIVTFLPSWQQEPRLPLSATRGR